MRWPWRKPAVPPENVRFVRADGTEMPVELVYEGWRDRSHQWVAVADYRPGPGWQLRIDMLPAKTTITCAVRRTGAR